MAITFVGAGTGATAASGNISPSLPAIIAGDVAFIVVSSDDAVEPSFPSGWTIVNTESVGYIQGTLAWKRLVGSETTILVTHAGGGAINASIAVWRGVIASGRPYSVSDRHTNSSDSSTVSTHSIVPLAGETVVFFGALNDVGYSSAYSGSDPTFTERMDYTGTGNLYGSVFAADGISSGAATGVRTARNTGSGSSVGWLLALSPETEAAPSPPPEPPPAPGTETPPATRFGTGRTPALWRFILAESTSLAQIGELTRARSKHLELVLNRSGSASFSLPIDNRMAYEVEPIQTCIVAVRNGLVVWSGPVWTIEEDVVKGDVTVTAAGWLELLFHRFVQSDVYTWAGASVDAGTIALGLLALANAVHPTHIIAGAVESTQPRQRTYLRGSNVGQEIIVLSDIESGYDVKVNPETRALDIYSTLGDDRTFDTHFVYGRNVLGFKRTLDASTLANRVTVIGPYGSAMQDDTASIAAYGVQEDFVSLSDVPEVEILAAYAGTEVVLRNTPRATYMINPFPTLGLRVPRPFDDYNVGDTILISARRGRVNIQGQGVRVFALTLDIDDNGIERVAEVRVAS